MTDWAQTGRGARLAGLHPAAQTAALFALVAGLLAVIPNGLVESVVAALGLPAPVAPPIGMAGRLALSVGGGLFAALAFAVVQWLRERRELARPVRRPLVDDRLTVEPLAARELGARFDDSPYLTLKVPAQPELVEPAGEPVPEPVPEPVVVSSAPPTPDSRIDPDSTMGDPRWRVPEHGEGAGPLGAPEGPADPARLIVRDGGWDREAPAPDAEWQAALPSETAPGPGNAAEQWDAEVLDAPNAPADLPAPAPVQRAPESARPAQPVDASPAPQPVEAPSLVRVSPARSAEAEGELPTTDELLERLMRAAAERSLTTAAPPAPPPLIGGAADELARAMEALKRGAA